MPHLSAYSQIGMTQLKDAQWHPGVRALANVRRARGGVSERGEPGGSPGWVWQLHWPPLVGDIPSLEVWRHPVLRTDY